MSRPNFKDSSATEPMPTRKYPSKKVLKAMERTELSELVVKELFRKGWTLIGKEFGEKTWVSPTWLDDVIRETKEFKKRTSNNGRTDK